MIEVVRYTPDQQPIWDAFAAGSKNGAFLFQRAYQDYHADRFPDHSLLFRRDGRLLALLPACRLGDELNSHGGLTFGGMLTDASMTTPLMLELFTTLLQHAREAGFKRLIYKAIPQFYHSLPADEDLYALTRHGARLFRRDVGSVLRLGSHPEFQERRRRSVKKALKAGLTVRETTDLAAYWSILEETLRARHGIAPVHSLHEIQRLRERLPDNIRLFAAYDGETMLAGSVVFENPSVAHAHYIASSLAGRDCGALDFVFSELITRIYTGKRWFSFGVSTESGGTVLNEGLIEHKEGFGARACVQDFYEIDL
jgi:hypothetical protein